MVRLELEEFCPVCRGQKERFRIMRTSDDNCVGFMVRVNFQCYGSAWSYLAKLNIDKEEREKGYAKTAVSLFSEWLRNEHTNGALINKILIPDRVNLYVDRGWVRVPGRKMKWEVFLIDGLSNPCLNRSLNFIDNHLEQWSSKPNFRH